MAAASASMGGGAANARKRCVECGWRHAESGQLAACTSARQAFSTGRTSGSVTQTTIATTTRACKWRWLARAQISKAQSTRRRQVQAGWRLHLQKQGHPQKRGRRWKRVWGSPQKLRRPHHHSLVWRQSRHVPSAWMAAMVSHVVGLILRSTCEAGATRHAVDPHSTLSAYPLGCLTRIQWRVQTGPCLCHPIARIAAAIGWCQPRVVCFRERSDKP